MKKNRWIALTIALLCVMSLLLLVGCGDSESDSDEVKQPNVNEAYVEHLAGKTFLPKNGGGSFLTFYQEGVATYDYGSDHYGY